jgi:hypothetical protein
MLGAAPFTLLVQRDSKTGPERHLRIAVSQALSNKAVSFNAGSPPGATPSSIVPLRSFGFGNGREFWQFPTGPQLPLLKFPLSINDPVPDILTVAVTFLLSLSGWSESEKPFRDTPLLVASR